MVWYLWRTLRRRFLLWAGNRYCFRPLLTGLFCYSGLYFTGRFSCFAQCAQGIYGGFQGFVFLMGLAILALTGWWWPGILILLGIASILGTLNIPGIAGLLGLGILSRNSQKPQEAYQPADHRYEGGYKPQQPPVTYQEGAYEYQYPSPSVEQPYEQPQTQYPQEMPPQ